MDLAFADAVLGGDAQPLLGGQRAQALHRVGKHGQELHRLLGEAQVAAHRARGVEQVVDEAHLVLDADHDPGERAAHRGIGLAQLVLEDVRPALDAVQRRAQLVRDDGEELVARERRGLGVGARAPLALERGGALLLARERLLFRGKALGDVQARAHESRKLRALEERHALVEEPPVLAVGAAQAILDLEGLARRKRLRARGGMPLTVLGMDPFAPPESQLALERPAGEFEPQAVEIDAARIGARKPDHDRREVGHEAEMIGGIAASRRAPHRRHARRARAHDAREDSPRLARLCSSRIPYSRRRL